MLAAHPEGAGATLALALILVVQGTLFGLLGYVVWKDQGWKPWMGAVLGAIVGFWPLFWVKLRPGTWLGGDNKDASPVAGSDAKGT
jgi:hypothetical protein